MESGLEVGHDGVQLVIALGFASLVAEFADSIVESALRHTPPETILPTHRSYVRYRTYCILGGAGAPRLAALVRRHAADRSLLQGNVAPGYWEITLLHVNMHGKALFFKTIAVQENEIRTNFQQVPDSLTLSEAAEQLQKQSTMKSAFAPSGSTVLAIGRSRSSSH
jgi:hypothetical protein